MKADLLNQFAMHAPAEIPAWFDVDNGCFEFSYPELLIDEPKISDFDLSESQQKNLEDWLLEPMWDLEDQLKIAGDRFQAYWDAEREHKNSRNLAYAQTRYFSWRFYYAQMMLDQAMKGTGFGVITMKILGELEAAKAELEARKAVDAFDGILSGLGDQS